MKIVEIEKSIYRLVDYISHQNYHGYDPYDGLYSEKLKEVDNYWFQFLIMQLHKFSPINLRTPFGIKKGIDIKGLGLFAIAYQQLLYSNLIDRNYLKHNINFIVNYLKNHSLRKEFGYYCWSGHYFNALIGKEIQSSIKPDIVSTTVCGEALLMYHEQYPDEGTINIIREILEFIYEYLFIDGDYPYFRYYPMDINNDDNRVILNATALAVKFITRSKKFINVEQFPLDALMGHLFQMQKSNGAWCYFYDNRTFFERNQIDFHQGFILDSIANYITEIDQNNVKGINALRNGAAFYKEQQFLPDGRSKWRWPNIWPIDIHNQAQGIITFTRLSEIFPEKLEFALKIAKWTIENMQDKEGYFYYQKWPYFTNKISYLRWGQAWMVLALSELYGKLAHSND